MNFYQPISAAPQPNGSSSTWTDQRTLMLLELWSIGCSASEIAKALGGFEHTKDGGRSAVIGRAHRLGAQRKIDEVFWSEAEDNLLRRLWARGDRALDISREMGGAFTPGAVKSRANRLGLPARRRRSERKVDQFGRKAPLVIDTTAFDADIPQEQRRTFMELESHHCRWPVGDPQAKDFFFCGAVKAGDGPYCAHHHRVAYAR